MNWSEVPIHPAIEHHPWNNWAKSGSDRPHQDGSAPQPKGWSEQLVPF